MDGTIPRNRLAGVLAKITELSEVYNLRVANVFHAGDGNLHPLILYDANKAGEHGVGVEKLDSMCSQFTAPELDIFHGIKKSF